MDTKSINDNIDFQTTFSNVSKKNHIFNSKNIKTSNDNIYDSTNNHFKTITQKRAVSDEKRADIFYCDQCDYKTDKKFNYLRHISSSKHKKKISGNNMVCKNISDNNLCCVQCGKTYETRSGLWKHLKKNRHSSNTDSYNMNINQTETHYTNTNNNYKHTTTYENGINSGHTEFDYSSKLQISSLDNEDKHNVYNIINTLILENRELHETLISQNENLSREKRELQNKVIELANQPRTIINQQNNTINILNYLKNECKDAMNLSEFIDSLHITFDDLLHLKEHGISSSIKKTVIQQLQDLDAKKRPIHCSDKKRKKFFVKEDDSWIRDEENKEIQKALRYVSMKQIEALQYWKQSNPNWLDDDNKLLNVNAITCEISKIYDTKEKKKIINNLSNLGIDNLQISI